MSHKPQDDPAQRDVIAFLSSPSTHGGAAVERIDTHTAVVFLAGDRVLKMKRAVRYDYVDFSTLERRRTCCEAEVRLNRRTAPALYRGVVPVTRSSTGLALNGGGETVEWLVEMKRFEQERVLDRLASSGGLEVSMMGPLAETIARFHQTAQPRPEFGGAGGMRWVVDGNEAGFREQGAGVLDEAACARVTTAARRELERLAGLLDARRDAGLVRQCHGDLHLRNIVLLEEGPTLFDAIEFNDAIACVDVLYDLAFLLMDLTRRRLPRQASALWNTYLSAGGTLDGIALMPLFLSCRAGVRAKTSATAARVQPTPERTRGLQEAAREYLGMAEALLAPPSPRLVAVGGLSGTGKSTLAMALAGTLGGAPGAVVLRSDEIRKRLLGAGPVDRLGADAYTPEVSARVYSTIRTQAATVLEAGYPVIADAVYARPDDREGVERVATSRGVPFTGIWLEAPRSVLTERVNARRGDVSDADASVVRAQLRQDTGRIAWHRVDASGAPGVIERRAADVVRIPAGPT